MGRRLAARPVSPFPGRAALSPGATAMTLRAIITETIPVGSRRRYFVGVAGTAPSGKHVYRPQFLHHGPWCKSAAARC